MIIRSVMLEGSVADAGRPEFDHHLRGRVREILATYPGILGVKMRWPKEIEEGAPPIYVCFDLYFTDLVAMHAALASPTRQAVRAAMREIMPLFQGRIFHLITEES
jgi:hypothetical protein